MPCSGTCYVWRAMRGSYLTTHFEPLHKLRAHQGAHWVGMVRVEGYGQRTGGA